MTRTASRRGLLELVAGDLSFPTSVACDEKGTAYVAESGLPFGTAEPGGRVWRLEDDSRSLLAQGLRAPVNGLAYWDGALYVSEGGHPARISRLTLDGNPEPILEGLPGPGNYHTNMAAFGPDGKLYFSQGAMTNTGIVGLDAYELGWLSRLPHAHDLPGHDVVLTGVDIETEDPARGGRTATGAFAPFGTSTRSGQSVGAQLPCTAAVMRCTPEGRELELVAWGLRNAYGLGFLPDGRLLAVDQGADDRGSRPVGNAPDLLYEVRQGAWYGWPDFIGGDAITEPRYHPARGDPPSFLLANHDELPRPEGALLRFPAHSAAVKFDVGPDGQLYIALFGDEAPMTTPERARAGRLVARIDPGDWSLHPIDTVTLQRPIDVRADRQGTLYVLDFGRYEIRPGGIVSAEASTGALWRLRV
jgi:glucose/arabinose dehydrogenase